MPEIVVMKTISMWRVLVGAIVAGMVSIVFSWLTPLVFFIGAAIQHHNWASVFTTDSFQALLFMILGASILAIVIALPLLCVFIVVHLFLFRPLHVISLGAYLFLGQILTIAAFILLWLIPRFIDHAAILLGSPSMFIAGFVAPYLFWKITRHDGKTLMS